MLRLRVVSALVGAPIILVASWLNGIFLFLLTAILMLAAFWEMHKILHRLNIMVPGSVFLGGAVVVLYGLYFYGSSLWPLVVSVLFLLNLVIIVLTGFKITLKEGMVSLLATIYVGLFSYLYLVGTLPRGWQWILLLLLATWANDICAYFVGTRLGRHKLAPAVSPNKTIEGAVGGLLGSVLVTLGWGWYFGLWEIQMLLVLGLLLAVAGQAGDLVESAIKRTAGIKDSGNLIPGHGGVLDRFDSMLMTAPLVYYFVNLFIVS